MIYKAIFLISLFVLTACEDNDKPKQITEYDRILLAEHQVKLRLKDPESAQFSQVRVHNDRIVCGYVNARNSFGGRNGAQGFISNGLSEATFFENDMKKEDFQYVWEQMCG